MRKNKNIKIVNSSFYNRDAQIVAKELLGKVIFHKYKKMWLAAQIIETEAYYLNEKGSHASLGYTEKRKALFMPPGTIYMYYARGKDSFNISTKGEGNAVLIKSGYPFKDAENYNEMIKIMQKLNHLKNDLRPIEKLCSGQTLLCTSLNLKVGDWDKKQFLNNTLFIADTGYKPEKIIQTTRLGIPKERDPHLLYRFIDYNFAKFCTKNINNFTPHAILS